MKLGRVNGQDLDEVADPIHCSDGGCVFGHPGGQHTNGGCKCLMPGRLTRFEIARRVRVLLDGRDALRESLLDQVDGREWVAECGAQQKRASEAEAEVLRLLAENKRLRAAAKYCPVCASEPGTPCDHSDCGGFCD